MHCTVYTHALYTVRPPPSPLLLPTQRARGGGRKKRRRRKWRGTIPLTDEHGVIKKKNFILSFHCFFVPIWATLSLGAAWTFSLSFSSPPPPPLPLGLTNRSRSQRRWKGADNWKGKRKEEEEEEGRGQCIPGIPKGRRGPLFPSCRPSLGVEEEARKSTIVLSVLKIMKKRESEARSICAKCEPLNKTKASPRRNIKKYKRDRCPSILGSGGGGGGGMRCAAGSIASSSSSYVTRRRARA